MYYYVPLLFTKFRIKVLKRCQHVFSVERSDWWDYLGGVADVPSQSAHARQTCGRNVNNRSRRSFDSFKHYRYVQRNNPVFPRSEQFKRISKRNVLFNASIRNKGQIRGWYEELHYRQHRNSERPKFNSRDFFKTLHPHLPVLDGETWVMAFSWSVLGNILARWTGAG